jgi:hypothetical protein
MYAALTRSRQNWEREEAEKQRRLLDPPAALPAPLIKLEDSSEDDWYRPTPSPPRQRDLGEGSSRWGAPGQSSSQQAPPPEDASDSNNDNSGHYTTFYLHFRM